MRDQSWWKPKTDGLSLTQGARFQIPRGARKRKFGAIAAGFTGLYPQIVLVLRSPSRSPSEHQPENEKENEERERFLTKRGETRPQLLEQKHFVNRA